MSEEVKSIGDEIKSKFQNEHQKAVINLNYTSYKVSSYFNSVLKPHDISGQQYNVLRILRGQIPNDASIGLIKDRMLDKSSDVSRMIDRLVAKGVVDRNQCPEDKRQRNVKITEKGLNLLEEIDKTHPDFNVLLGDLSEEEMVKFNAILDKIRSCF